MTTANEHSHPAEEQDLDLELRRGLPFLPCIHFSSLWLTHSSHLNKLCLVLLEATKEVLTLFIIFTVWWQASILINPIQHDLVPDQTVLRL
jgi:hypothetical protein